MNGLPVREEVLTLVLRNRKTGRNVLSKDISHLNHLLCETTEVLHDRLFSEAVCSMKRNYLADDRDDLDFIVWQTPKSNPSLYSHKNLLVKQRL